MFDLHIDNQPHPTDPPIEKNDRKLGFKMDYKMSSLLRNTILPLCGIIR